MSLSAQRNASSGALISPLNLFHPNVDMHFNAIDTFGNFTLRPDLGADPFQAVADFTRINVCEGSYDRAAQRVADHYDWL